jgi:signal transduction histidine kinase
VKGNVKFVFKDTGIGMSPETLSKLWVPLFTTKAKGMGFGLPIAKRIIEAHGGKISIKSIRGKGTTVTVTLPIDSGPVGEAKAPLVFTESKLQMVCPSIETPRKPA